MNCPRCGKTPMEHEAGRCMDAWVAEALVGWERVGNWLYQKDDAWFDYGNPLTGPFSPSTSIADAWEVVEKMTEDGFCPALVFDDDGRWALATNGVQNCPKEGETLYTSFEIEPHLLSDTAPLAICRAALMPNK